jgi:hypothetical protein
MARLRFGGIDCCARASRQGCQPYYSIELWAHGLRKFVRVELVPIGYPGERAKSQIVSCQESKPSYSLYAKHQDVVV